MPNRTKTARWEACPTRTHRRGEDRSNTRLIVGVGGFPNPTGFLYDARSDRFLETAAQSPYDVNDAGQVADSRDVGEVAINNRGQVIGDGFGGVGYLLTPMTVPEPSPIVLCGAVAGLGLARSAARRVRSARGGA